MVWNFEAQAYVFLFLLFFVDQGYFVLSLAEEWVYIDVSVVDGELLFLVIAVAVKKDQILPSFQDYILSPLEHNTSVGWFVLPRMVDVDASTYGKGIVKLAIG